MAIKKIKLPDNTVSDIGAKSSNVIYDGTVLTQGDSVTDILDNLKAQIDEHREIFHLQDFTQTFPSGITVPNCTQDIANTSIANIDINLDIIDPSGDLGNNYAIASLAKYEVYDATSGGNRINCWPVCSFSMNGQRILRIRMMCGGTSNKIAKRIAGAMLLKHR